MRYFKVLLYSLIFSYSSLYSFSCGYDYYLFDTTISPNPEKGNSLNEESLAYNFGVTIGTSERIACDLGRVRKQVFTWGGQYIQTDPDTHSFVTTYYYKQYNDNPCVEPDIYNPDTYSCEAPPLEEGEQDHDNDGIPNKCDPYYLDFDNLDCDGDGIPNGQDKNPFEAGEDDLDVGCKGVNLSDTGSLPFPFNSYRFVGKLDEFKCSRLLLEPNYDAVVNISDINAPNCEYSYCYAHEVKNDCSFDASWYRPGTNWDYLPNKSEIECDLLVDGIKYSQNTYVTPDTLKCPTSGLCYLKRIDEKEEDLATDTNSEENDESMNEVDLNSTTSELSPLLNAQNTTNKHLSDLKDKTDYSNKRLDDLKELSKDTLNNNKQMKSVLDGLKSNSDNSLINQLQGLSSLSSINDNIGTMSDAVTTNQGVMNNNLSSIDEKMTINNTLLTDIKDSFSGDFDDPFDSEIDDGLSSDIGGIEADIKGSFSGFVYNNIFSFASQTYTIPTISFSSSLGSFTVLDSSMLASLDINSIRAMFLFFFAVAGFITVFKTI